MDAIDREIVRTVQHDARISYRDLGRAVGLSPNAAADRLRRLLRSGVLQILAVVDPGADVRLRVLIDVQLRQDQSDDAFEAAIRDLPDAASLDRLLRELKRRTGVAATNTRVILRTTLPRR